MTAPVVIRWHPSGWFICHAESYQSAVRNNSFLTKAAAIQRVRQEPTFELVDHEHDQLREPIPLIEFYGAKDLFSPLMPWEYA